MKTILTCAITGSFDTTRKNPAVPVTPHQIAQSAIEAAQAGASIVHLHVRDLETTLASMELDLYRQTVEEIRASDVDVVINLTCGAGARYMPGADDPAVAAPGTTLCSPEKRVEHVLALKPEICTLDLGSMNFGPHAMINTPSHLRIMAELVRDAGVRPELECFDTGHVLLGIDMMKAGLLTGAPLFQLCLGISYGAPADAAALVDLRRRIPEGAHWGAFGVGPQSFAIAAMTAAMGGTIRVGLEDNLYLSRGQLAPSNAALVERAVTICNAMNVEIATPAEAREILQLAG